MKGNQQSKVERFRVLAVFAFGFASAISDIVRRLLPVVEERLRGVPGSPPTAALQAALLLAIIAIGLVLYGVKRKELFGYAILEGGVGGGIALDAVRMVGTSDPVTIMVKIAGAIYFLVRAFDNGVKGYEGYLKTLDDPGRSDNDSVLAKMFPIAPQKSAATANSNLPPEN